MSTTTLDEIAQRAAAYPLLVRALASFLNAGEYQCSVRFARSLLESLGELEEGEPCH